MSHLVDIVPLGDCLLIIIRDELEPGGGGHATYSQPAIKQFTLFFDDVTCSYHHDFWHV